MIIIYKLKQTTMNFKLETKLTKIIVKYLKGLIG